MTNKIHKFSDYSRYDSMAEDFINSFDSMIVESDKSDDYKSSAVTYYLENKDNII